MRKKRDSFKAKETEQKLKKLSSSLSLTSENRLIFNWSQMLVILDLSTSKRNPPPPPPPLLPPVFPLNSISYKITVQMYPCLIRNPHPTLLC